MTTPKPPPHPTLVVLVLLLVAVELLWRLLRPVLAHGIALALTLAQWRPKVQQAQPIEALAIDATPAPRPTPKPRRRRTRSAALVTP